MGIFMRHDIGDALELGTGGFIGIDQQRGFTKGDGAQILHGAGGEIGDGDQIQLIAGIRDAVVAG